MEEAKAKDPNRGPAYILYNNKDYRYQKKIYKYACYYLDKGNANANANDQEEKANDEEEQSKPLFFENCENKFLRENEEQRFNVVYQYYQDYKQKEGVSFNKCLEELLDIDKNVERDLFQKELKKYEKYSSRGGKKKRTKRRRVKSRRRRSSRRRR